MTKPDNYESNVGAPRTRGKAMSKQMLERRLRELDCSPTDGLAMIGMNKVECTRCDSENKVSYYAFLIFLEFDDPLLLESAQKQSKKMLCPECAGSGKIQVSISDRRAAYQALLDRLIPKLAAHKIEAEVRRPVVHRAHAMDEDADATMIRKMISILDSLEGASESEQERIMELFAIALREDDEGGI